MGALVAIADISGRADVVPYALDMMSTLKHRGSDRFGLATAEAATNADSVEDLARAHLSSPAAIGYNLDEVLRKDIPQPLSSGDTRFAFEGRLYPTDKNPDAHRALSWLQKHGMSLPSFVRSVSGSYVLAALHCDSLLLARDLVGCRPLYQSAKHDLIAFASEKKALCAIGMEEHSPFPPGQYMIIGGRKIHIRRLMPLSGRPNTKLNLASAANTLSRLLMRALNDRIGDIEEVAVAYSGGLDSGLIAASLKLVERVPRLLHVTARDGEDLKRAFESASEMDLELNVRRVSESEISEAIGEVLFRIEDRSPVSLSIALAIYFASRFAAKLHLPVLLAGQGADELFGGYSRYVSALKTEGVSAVANTLETDVRECYLRNYQRDEQASAGNHVELRLPYADQRVIDFSVSLPVGYKISPDHTERKVVLRRVAQLHGAPASIYNAPKRAVQYSTGMLTLMKNAARRERISLQDYIRRIDENRPNHSAQILWA